MSISPISSNKKSGDVNDDGRRACANDKCSFVSRSGPLFLPSELLFFLFPML
jgi:hypothetical protein